MARLLLFGAIADLAGTRQTVIEARTLGELIDVATDRFGESFGEALRACAIAVNGSKLEAFDPTIALEGDTEVAVLPPVSGGSVSSDHGADKPTGEVRMADVSAKEPTLRTATAECFLRAEPQVIERILRGELPKGKALAVAEVAAVLGAKATPAIVPLCHPVAIDGVTVEFERHAADALRILATVRGRDRTGFEMEALTASVAAALAIYDMAKQVTPDAVIGPVRLLAKEGGSSGSWRANAEDSAGTYKAGQTK
jgi:cyclic pyranopterin phosphate synthase